MRALEERDLLFFRDHGYVVVHDAVPPALCRAAAEALWAFLEMDPDDPDGWYRYPARPGVTTVEMYHHQALWDIRQFPRVYDVFVDILGEERLWVSIDRASFKPPRHRRHPEYDFKGFIHWDGDPAVLSTLRVLVLQGVLCLTDTDERMGGFQCVPGHHRRLEEWLASRAGAASGWSGPGRRWLRRMLDPSGGASQRARPDPLSAESLTRAAWLSGYPAAAVTRFSSSAGDLIIWDQRLPHGNGRNVSGRPRLGQYVTMFPAREDDGALRDARIRMWRERTAPLDGDPRAWERDHCEPATLTDLGRRLLGLDAWTPAVP
jgi:hypothetical protein